MSTWNASTQAYSDCVNCEGKGFWWNNRYTKHVERVMCRACLQRRIEELEAVRAQRDAALAWCENHAELDGTVLTVDVEDMVRILQVDASLIDYDAPLTTYDQEHIAILERLLRQEAEIARLKDELGACEAEANDTSVEHVMALEQEREAAKAEAALWSLSGEVFSQQTLKLAAAEMVIESGKAYIAELQAERAAALADAAALRTALEVIASNDLRLLAAYMREHNIATRDHYVAAIREVAKSALASTTAGADLLAQLRQAEAQRDALVAAARPFVAAAATIPQHERSVLRRWAGGDNYIAVDLSTDDILALAAAVKATEGGE